MRVGTRPAMIRPTAILPFLFIAVSTTQAQGDLTEHFWARLVNPVTTHSSKPMFAALLRLDPSMDITYEDEELRITSARAWTGAEVRTAVEPLGYQVMAFGPAGNTLEQQGWTPPAGWPRYIDTGDAAADHARLEADRNAWIAANPAIHQDMLTHINTLGREE